MSIVLSRVYHTETHKLQELNKIYQNPKARVVVGKEHGSRVIKKMKTIANKNKGKEPHPAKKRKLAKASKRPRPVEEEERSAEAEPMMMNQSFNYSVFDGQSDAYPSLNQSKEIEMKTMENHQKSAGASTGGPPLFTIQQVQQMLDYQQQRM